MGIVALIRGEWKDPSVSMKTKETSIPNAGTLKEWFLKMYNDQAYLVRIVGRVAKSKRQNVFKRLTQLVCGVYIRAMKKRAKCAPNIV